MEATVFLPEVAGRQRPAVWGSVMAAQLTNTSGEVYLQQVDALRNEIGEAMAAISCNRLQAFEESLWRQEILCVGLKRLLGAAERSASGDAGLAALGSRIQSSMTALQQVNRTYAELLRQAQSSNHLLFVLYQTYHDAARRERTSPTGTRCSLEA